MPILPFSENLSVNHGYSDLGALLPGNYRASRVIDRYLDTLIHTASSDSEIDHAEKERKNDTLLGSMIAQNIDPKLIKDQLMAILLGGKVGFLD